MYVGIVIHSDKDNEGVIGKILESLGIDYDIIEIYRTGRIDGAYSHIILTGGPMGAYEEEKYPFLREEKSFLRKFVMNSGKVLGICLGAQILADALGGRAYPHIKERGWVRIRKIASHPVCSGLPDLLHVFQWHGDSFDLPPGSKLLYAGETVRNQFFTSGSATGVQFHPEVTLETIREWSKNEMDAETRKQLIEKSVELIDDLHNTCKKILENFVTI